MTESVPDGSDPRAEVHARMLAALPKTHPHPALSAFYDLLHIYPNRAGKMLRGRLVVQAAAAFGADAPRALDVAAALELFQNWVLIHDDIEDDSEERRGAPALHRMVGMPVALNVGDALHVYMWDLLHRVDADPGIGAEIRGEFLEMIHRTAEGQHLDLAWVAQGRFDITEDDYLRMVALKTARYTVTAPLRLGAICAGVEPPAAFTHAGVDLGAAFQIRDDVLNLMRDRGAYGKEFAGDLYEGKRTLILAHLFAHASADEATALVAKLHTPRAEREDEDVRWILAAIERHGSLAYAQERAETLARTGLAALTEGLAAAPDRDAADRVEALMHDLAARSA